MRLSYDIKYNVGYLSFKEKTEQVNSIKLSEDLILDMSADGTIYGIELLNIKDQLFGDKKSDFLLLNENTGMEKAVEMPI